MTERGESFYAYHRINFVDGSYPFRSRLRDCGQHKQCKRQCKRGGSYVTAADSDRDGQSGEREHPCEHEHEEHEYEKYEEHEHGQEEALDVIIKVPSGRSEWRKIRESQALGSVITEGVMNEITDSGRNASVRACRNSRSFRKSHGFHYNRCCRCGCCSKDRSCSRCCTADVERSNPDVPDAARSSTARVPSSDDDALH